MKVFIVTDKYAVCDKCDAGAHPDDPIIEMGSALIGLLRLHKSCFDSFVSALNQMVDGWKRLHGKQETQ